MKKQITIVSSLLLCALVLIGWYYYEQSKWFPVPDHSSITRMKISGKHIRVELRTKADLRHCVFLEVFGTFTKPVETVDEAIANYGTPDNIYTDRIEYWLEHGRIVFCREHHYGGISYGVQFYPVPTLSAEAELICDSVMQHVSPSQTETIIVFTDARSDLLFLATLQGRRVDWFEWVDITTTHRVEKPRPDEHIP